MQASGENPQENCLPKGINEEALLEAIDASGYPLQIVVAAALPAEFSVMEEWGFIDPDTEEHRTIDVRAMRWAGVPPRSRPIVGPGLVLLIECKRSKHPYVFFKSVSRVKAPGFPLISGLPPIRISTPDGVSTDGEPDEVLGLAGGELVGVPLPPVCTAFARAIPKGKKVTLSGKEPYNSVVIPLVKALRHELRSEIVSDPIAHGLLPNLTIPLAVIDAPMLLVESPGEPRQPVLTPWVRVSRHEYPRASAQKRSPIPFYSIDVIHAGYLNTYLSQYLDPFTRLFDERVRAQADILRNGGLVDQLFGWSWDRITPAGERIAG